MPSERSRNDSGDNEEDSSFLDDIDVPTEPISDSEWKEIDEWAEEEDNMGIQSESGGSSSPAGPKAEAAAAGSGSSSAKVGDGSGDARSPPPTSATTPVPNDGKSSEEASPPKLQQSVAALDAQAAVELPTAPTGKTAPVTAATAVATAAAALPEPHAEADVEEGEGYGVVTDPHAAGEENGSPEAEVGVAVPHAAASAAGTERAPAPAEILPDSAAISIKQLQPLLDTPPPLDHVPAGVAAAAGSQAGGGWGSGWGLGALGRLSEVAAGEAHGG